MEKNTSKLNNVNNIKMFNNTIYQKENEFSNAIAPHLFLTPQNAKSKYKEDFAKINSSQYNSIPNENYWNCLQGTPYYSEYEGYSVPQIKCFFSQKIPLKTLKDEEYIYVNSKQYYRILKRREKRKKLNEVFNNSCIKVKTKKYFHESRHIHAMNRQRGKGGRFLSKIEKEIELKEEENDVNKSDCNKDA